MNKKDVADRLEQLAAEYREETKQLFSKALAIKGAQTSDQKQQEYAEGQFLEHLDQVRKDFIVNLFDAQLDPASKDELEDILLSFDQLLRKYKAIGPPFPGIDCKCDQCNNTGWEPVADDGQFYCDCVIGEAMKQEAERIRQNNKPCDWEFKENHLITACREGVTIRFNEEYGERLKSQFNFCYHCGKVIQKSIVNGGT